MLTSRTVSRLLALSPFLLAPSLEASSKENQGTIHFEKKAPPLFANWTSIEGHELKTYLTAVNEKNIVFKKGTFLKTTALSQLSFKSRIYAHFWMSSNGTQYTLPASTLVYKVRTNPTTTEILKIHYDGKYRSSVWLQQFKRRLEYDHQEKKFTVLRSSLEKLAVGAPLTFTATEHSSIQALNKWHPTKVGSFTGRFTRSTQFPSGQLTLANVTAPPVTALLAILNGQHLHYDSGHFGHKFPDFKINAFSLYETDELELEKALQLAHTWEMLPLKLHWKAKVTKANGSLELKSIKPLEKGNF